MTKRFFLTAAFVLLVMGYFAAFAIFNRKPAPLAEPTPNGYHDFVAATSMVACTGD